MSRLCLALLFVSLVVAKATVVITDIPDVPLFGALGFQELEIDLDGNGSFDFSIQADRASMRVVTLADEVRVATFVTGGLDRGGNNLPFSYGSIIGESLVLGASWYQANAANGNSNLLACRDIGCIGLWGGGINYVGIQISDAFGNERYGWVEIDAPFANVSGGFVTRYAFENEANTPIVAIPEPSGVLLSGLGAILGLLKRSRKSIPLIGHTPSHPAGKRPLQRNPTKGEKANS